MPVVWPEVQSRGRQPCRQFALPGGGAHRVFQVGQGEVHTARRLPPGSACTSGGSFEQRCLPFVFLGEKSGGVD